MQIRRLLTARLPFGVWLAGAAAGLAVVAWLYLVAFYVSAGLEMVVLAPVVAPLALAPLVPLWCLRAGRPFRPAAATIAALELAGSVFLLWIGGLIFAPSGVLLAFAALFGATDRSALPG
jgi:hypothetical protein